MIRYTWKSPASNWLRASSIWNLTSSGRCSQWAAGRFLKKKRIWEKFQLLDLKFCAISLFSWAPGQTLLDWETTQWRRQEGACWCCSASEYTVMLLIGLTDEFHLNVDENVKEQNGEEFMEIAWRSEWPFLGWEWRYRNFCLVSVKRSFKILMQMFKY